MNEFLDQLGLVRPEGEIRAVATYHDACHLLHAQKIHDAPRQLLAQIPGLEVRDLPESELCCGAAGTYNLTQPEMSARLSRRKMENIKQTGARIAITSNAGCAPANRPRSSRAGRAARRGPSDGNARLELSQREAAWYR